jgi:hypothetical protein
MTHEGGSLTWFMRLARRMGIHYWVLVSAHWGVY